jgi:hypothetical protein
MQTKASPYAQFHCGVYHNACTAYASAANKDVLNVMQERQEQVAACRAALQQTVSGLEDLKAVLGAASALEEGAVQWDLDCADLEERFRCCTCPSMQIACQPFRNIISFHVR